MCIKGVNQSLSDPNSKSMVKMLLLTTGYTACKLCTRGGLHVGASDLSLMRFNFKTIFKEMNVSVNPLDTPLK